MTNAQKLALTTALWVLVTGCTPSATTPQSQQLSLINTQQNWWNDAPKLESWTTSIKPNSTVKTDGFYTFSQLQLNRSRDQFIGMPRVNFKGTVGDLALKYNQRSGIEAVSWISPDIIFRWAGEKEIRASKELVYMRRGELGPRGLVINPTYFNWYYQSSGIWLQPLPRSETLNLGAGTFGRNTDEGTIPTTGTKQYTAYFLGYIFEKNKPYSLATAEGTIVIDFAANSMDFTINSISKNNESTGQVTPSELRYSGSFGFTRNSTTLIQDDSGMNEVKATLKTQFYGPYVMEVGGIVHLSTDRGISFLGSFGAR